MNNSLGTLDERRSIFGFFIFPFFVFVAILLLNIFNDMGFEKNIVLAASTTILGQIISILVMKKLLLRDLSWRESLFLRGTNIKSVLYAIFGGIFLLIFLQVLSIIFVSTGLVVNDSKTSTSILEVDGVLRYILLFFIVPVVVPIIEELSFRGLIFSTFFHSTMNKVRGFLLPAILSSFFFGMAHAQGFSNFNDYFVIGWSFFLGFVCSWSVWKTKSIIVSIMIHLSYNLGTILLALLL